MRKIFPEIRRITIAQSVLEDISAMAQSAHPKEMIAFFSSTKGNLHGHGHIDELQLQAYDASDDSAHVSLNNIPMTTNIIGTVHSHPGGSVRPSDADIHFFSKLGYINAIIGEPYHVKNIQFYDKNARKIRVEAL